MEDIEKIAEKIVDSVENIIRKYDAEVKTIMEQLDKIVEGGNNLNQTPQNNKKKAKRLSIIADTESEDSLISEKEAPSSKDSNNSTIKKSVENSSRQDQDEPNTTTSRPVRAAKLKVEKALKEQSLRAKLRRPSKDQTVPYQNNVEIKQEKKSDILKNGSEKENLKMQSDIESIKRKSSDRDGTQTEKDVEEPSKKVDESLVIMNNKEPPVVELLSDDEVDKMPPPVTIPKKRNALRKAKSTDKISDVSTNIKLEKQSMDNNSGKGEKLVDMSVPSKPSVSSVKKEKISDVVSSDAKETKAAPTKSKRGRKPKHRPIKIEKLDEDSEEIADNSVKTSSAETGKIQQTTSKKQASIDSLYEDAVSEIGTKESVAVSDKKEKTSEEISNTKSLEVNQEAENNTEKMADATFLSAVDVQVTNQSPDNAVDSCPQSTFVMENKSAMPNNENTGSKMEKEEAAVQQNNDQTFITNIAQTTFVMNEGDNQISPKDVDSQQVKAVKSTCSDATFSVSDKSKKEEQNNATTENSILTEDDSDEEYVAIAKLKFKAKAKNELFNPCVESPVKKKVEAFERHANVVNGSSSEQRQTRTKTRAKTKENKEPQVTTSSASKTTPMLVRNFSRLLTPTQQTITPTANNVLRKPPTSSSKLPCPKVNSKPLTVTSASVSRESSAEDMKRGINKLQQLEEKKKKREQKQQMAFQTREAKERERAEKLKKAIEEREEKARRKAIEAEQKRQLEEINRNLKLQEEKREAQKRLEKQKQIEMAEAARKEREMLEALKIQKAKERLVQERKLLEQKKMAKKGHNHAYDFNMLNSDDSTDDEGKTSAKRPPPPTWSKSSVRQLFIERQANLPTKIIDSFFSVQAMTPDLREIFPKIDSRYLKRNSSVFWRTPPRYSELPKY